MHVCKSERRQRVMIFIKRPSIFGNLADRAFTVYLCGLNNPYNPSEGNKCNFRRAPDEKKKHLGSSKFVICYRPDNCSPFPCLNTKDLPLAELESCRLSGWIDDFIGFIWGD